MLPPVGRDDSKAMIGLGQHHHELRGLNDLTEESESVEADVYRAESNRYAPKRRVVLVTERFSALRGPGLVQARKGRRPFARRRRWRSGGRSRGRSAERSHLEIAAGPPDAGQIRMTIGQAGRWAGGLRRWRLARLVLRQHGSDATDPK